VSLTVGDVAALTIRCGKKVWRSVEHLKALEASAKEFGEKYGRPGFPAIVEANSQGTKILVKLAEDPEFPEIEWGIIIGDAVHCLRSALDQLVSGLWTDTTDGKTRFPICRSEKEWITEAPAMYWSVPQPLVAIFDRAQPYHCGNKADDHPLAILNALWNFDKHKAIPAVALAARDIKIEVVGAERFPGWEKLKFRTHPGRALKKGAILGEAPFRESDVGPEAKVDVYPHLSVNVAFGQINKASVISGKPVFDTFQNLLIPAVFGVMKEVFAEARSRAVSP
jgi:hypothetical protein